MVELFIMEYLTALGMTMVLLFLDSRYSRPMPWKEVALKLFGDDDDKHQLATFRLHGRALQCLKNRGDEANGK